MFRPTIVIWLVLLVLALNVVAFATRIIDKCRLANRFSKSSGRTHFHHTEQSTGDFEPTDPAETSVGFDCLAERILWHSRSRNRGTNVGRDSVRDGDRRG